jgi:hypothetical protein
MLGLGAKIIRKEVMRYTHEITRRLFEGIAVEEKSNLEIESGTEELLPDIEAVSRVLPQRKGLNATSWYNNPNIGDLLLLIGSSPEFAESTISLYHYDKVSGKGLHQFTKDEASGKWKAKLLDNLNNKIVYYPILTIGTQNKQFVVEALKKILDNIDGLDNGNRGIPKLILIPVSLCHNHFGIITIAPKQSNQGENLPKQDKARVFYFNSLPSEDYFKEETLFFDYLIERYSLSKGLDSIIYNDDAKQYVQQEKQQEVEKKEPPQKHPSKKERRQTDGNQCGPFIIEYALMMLRAAKVNDIWSEDFTYGEKFNQLRLGYSYNQLRFGYLDTTGEVLKVRHNHAQYLKGFPTDGEIILSLQVQQLIAENSNWWNQTNFEFPSPPLIPDTKAMVAMRYTNMFGRVVRAISIAGGPMLDLFELRPETSGRILAMLAEHKNKVVIINEKDLTKTEGYISCDETGSFCIKSNAEVVTPICNNPPIADVSAAPILPQEPEEVPQVLPQPPVAQAEHLPLAITSPQSLPQTPTAPLESRQPIILPPALPQQPVVQLEPTQETTAPHNTSQKPVEVPQQTLLPPKTESKQKASSWPYLFGGICGGTISALIMLYTGGVPLPLFGYFGLNSIISGTLPSATVNIIAGGISGAGIEAGIRACYSYIADYIIPIFYTTDEQATTNVASLPASQNLSHGQVSVGSPRASLGTNQMHNNHGEVYAR